MTALFAFLSDLLAGAVAAFAAVPSSVHAKGRPRAG